MSRSGSPTLQIIGIFIAVYVLEAFGGLIGISATWFALAAPTVQPWTVVTSVYAHSGLNHLVVNALALFIVGLPLERFSSWLRFHGFFLVTGAVAGLVQIAVMDLLGSGGGVLGASGAILALYGYVIAGNRLTGGLLTRLSLSRRSKLLLLGIAAASVVILTAGPGVALVAHGTGFALGLIGGRIKLLGR
mgnify:CR=1 FL=1